MSTLNIFQVSLEIWGCIICITTAVISSASVHRIGGVLKSVWTMLLVNCFYLSSDALAYIFRGDLSSIGKVMTRISNFSMFFLEGVLMLFYAYTILQIIFKDKKQIVKSKYFIASIILVTIQLIGVIITPFTQLYYYFDPVNRYVRGDGMIISMCSLSLVAILGNFDFYKHKDTIPKKTVNIFVYCVCAFSAYLIIQMLFYGISLINIGSTVIILILFINLWNDASHETTQEYIMELEETVKVLQSKESEGNDA